MAEVEYIGDEGATAVEEREWRAMDDEQKMFSIDGTVLVVPGGTFAPVQTLMMNFCPCSDNCKALEIREENGTYHEVFEIYCSTSTTACFDSHTESRFFQTVGRLRIVDRVAYIDLD